MRPRFVLLSAEQIAQVLLQADNLQLCLSDFFSDLSQAKLPRSDLSFRVDFFQRNLLF